MSTLDLPSSTFNQAQKNLNTKKLNAGHDKHLVIKDLDLTLELGQVTAIVGPNGCGKSTLLNTLGRILKPLGGEVFLNYKNIHEQPGKEVAKELALLPQETHAPEGMTVLDLIRFGRQPYQSWFNQWSLEDEKIVMQALEAANLYDLKDRPLDKLSGGQRQRAWIAMSIAQNTPFLLLDEPTSALDLGHQIEVFELIKTLSQQGKTVVMVVHDLISASRYADQLIALNEGQIIKQGPPTEVLTKELIRTLYKVDCEVIQDPINNTPLLINVRKIKN